MEFDFNTDNWVKVRLTEEGLRILESRHNEVLKKSPGLAITLGAFKAHKLTKKDIVDFSFLN